MDQERIWEVIEINQDGNNAVLRDQDDYGHLCFAYSDGAIEEFRF